MFNPEFAQFGFAAVMAGALLWVIVKLDSRHSDNYEKIRKEHMQERTEWGIRNTEDRKAMIDAIKSLEDHIRLK